MLLTSQVWIYVAIILEIDIRYKGVHYNLVLVIIYLWLIKLHVLLKEGTDILLVSPWNSGLRTPSYE